MGKDIKLNSNEWCDIVFEKKNKAYGAYKLRQSASKRYLVAFLATFILSAFVVVLPGMIAEVKKLAARNAESVKDDFELTNIPIEEQVKQEDLIKKETAPPPPPLKSTVKFTPPVITADDQIADDKVMKTVDDLSNSKLTISVADVKGTDEKHGVNIADLDKHKVVVEVKRDDKPLVVVEQMPTFPGGEAEMYRFIKDNLKYPVVAQETGLQGRVTVRFVVTKTGKISDVQVLRGFDSSCDNEAKRVVNAMPNWIPGKQNGVNVAVYYTIPIVFKLQN